MLDDEAVLGRAGPLRRGGLEIGLQRQRGGAGRTIDRAVELGAFDAVQATYNLLERGAGPALERAHAAGMRVVVKEALANGRLTPRGGVAQLEAAARRAGSTSDAVALAWLLHRPWVDVVLSGAATAEQSAEQPGGGRRSSGRPSWTRSWTGWARRVSPTGPASDSRTSKLDLAPPQR